jgi:SAM-dependent methyltransferase
MAPLYDAHPATCGDAQASRLWQAVGVTEARWAARFERSVAGPASTVRERIWREVFGLEYPEGTAPFSYISVTELRVFAREVRLESGQGLVDIGCGRGGPGLWVAAATGARLIGLDITESALGAARREADRAGLAGRSGFRRGSFEDTGLPDGSAHAVMSIDALLFTPSKQAAAAELARVIVPGGRLVLTSWDYHRRPPARPPQVADHRPLLDQAGFDIVSYAETEAWRERQERTGLAMLAAVGELAAESGADPGEVRAGLEEMHATLACMTRRVLVVAQRRTA